MARIAGFALILAALMEVATLVLVGSRIGVGWTILLVLAGFVAGALVIRSTGL
ncbi:MAG: FxsA family protein, partial [Alphaproteobacteria bacterium]|nr:FxsA family protein [Alphaproteobacteria bacterium]